MPYPKHHKQKSREAIIQSVSRAFRKSGINSVSVPQIMKAAGLTHGGFYAHFESKDRLIAEACKESMKESIEFYKQIVTESTPKNSLIKIIKTYLSLSHLTTPEQGCILPAVGSEIGKQVDLVRDSYKQSLDDFIDYLGQFFPDNHKKHAIFLASSMVGAMMTARAINDTKRSKEIILNCRQQLIEFIESLFIEVK